MENQSHPQSTSCRQPPAARSCPASVSCSPHLRNRQLSSGAVGFSSCHHVSQDSSGSVTEDLPLASPASSVRVIVRVRPKLPHEVQLLDGCVVSHDFREITLSGKQGKTKSFTFPLVLDAHVSQTDMFQEVGVELVDAFKSGHNVCVLAHGYTGSGKTFTMFGDRLRTSHGLVSSKAGLIPRCLQRICSTQNSELGEEPQRYLCEFYELYNDTLVDLLHPDFGNARKMQNKRAPKVHLHPKRGVWIEDLTSVVVDSFDGVMNLLERGHRGRSVAATGINANSSRSHVILNVRSDRCSAPLGTSSGSRALASKKPDTTFTFVDLAGREDSKASQDQSVHFLEMRSINASLFHLTCLIQKLTESSAKRSQFRNCRLTMVLSPALSGASLTSIVATVSPLKAFFNESSDTLSFASCAMRRVVPPPPLPKKPLSALVAELESQISRLKQELVTSQTQEAIRLQELHYMQALIYSYRKSLEESRNCSHAYSSTPRSSIGSSDDLTSLVTSIDFVDEGNSFTETSTVLHMAKSVCNSRCSEGAAGPDFFDDASCQYDTMSAPLSLLPAAEILQRFSTLHRHADVQSIDESHSVKRNTLAETSTMATSGGHDNPLITLSSCASSSDELHSTFVSCGAFQEDSLMVSLPQVCSGESLASLDMTDTNCYMRFPEYAAGLGSLDPSRQCNLLETSFSLVGAAERFGRRSSSDNGTDAKCDASSLGSPATSKCLDVSCVPDGSEGVHDTSQCHKVDTRAPMKAKTMVVAGAASGAVIVGSASGVVGTSIGFLAGGALGLVPALFTFGLSLPVGASLGAGVGLALGTSVGGSVGVVGGGAVGWWYSHR